LHFRCLIGLFPMDWAHFWTGAAVIEIDKELIFRPAFWREPY
jgi:hypothetical protein